MNNIKTLSNFALGAIGVDVLIDHKTDGGTANARDMTTGRANICVGISNGQIRATEVLMHEAFELSASLRGYRYREDASFPEEGSENTIFLMTHKEMQLIFSDIASVVSGAMPMIAEEVKKLESKSKQ